MPLMYLPLIMYVGWMEFMIQPLCLNADRTDLPQSGDAAH
jgi:hypothetical protein